jgi:hypothetical protein
LSKPFPQKQEQNNVAERNFSYHYIRNLLNYPEEQVTTYTPDVDDVIKDQLREQSSLQVEVNDDEVDDS